MEPLYRTDLGSAYCADSMNWLAELEDDSVSLAVTSPPFALLREKKYGNLRGDEYVAWLLGFARELLPKLTLDGSFVIDIGGSYERGLPTRTLAQWKFLIAAVEEVGYHLAQECYWNNPAKLPTPIEWVNKRKIRLKDPVDTVWWLSRSPWPKVDTTRVLQPYSNSMLDLLRGRSAKGIYKRPSGHTVTEKTFHDNGGALPSHLISISNTDSNGAYLRACKAAGISPHPARFPSGLPEFFIKLLTDPDDLVIDFFAGSNTTGAVAQGLGRRWMSCDLDPSYVAASAFRLMMPDDDPAAVYASVLAGPTVYMRPR